MLSTQSEQRELQQNSALICQQRKQWQDTSTAGSRTTTTEPLLGLTDEVDLEHEP